MAASHRPQQGHRMACLLLETRLRTRRGRDLPRLLCRTDDRPEIPWKAGGSQRNRRDQAAVRPFVYQERLRHLPGMRVHVGILPTGGTEIQERPDGYPHQIPRHGGMAHLHGAQRHHQSIHPQEQSSGVRAVPIDGVLLHLLLQPFRADPLLPLRRQCHGQPFNYVGLGTLHLRRRQRAGQPALLEGNPLARRAVVPEVSHPLDAHH